MLSPEDTQLLMAYMQKNRGNYAPMMQPPQLPQQQQSGGFPDGKELLKAIGSIFDQKPMQGPVQPGAAPLDNGQSMLSKFATPGGNIGFGDLLRSLGGAF
jgi:hypothetical protein